ncbi:ABSCISIC ACID-INSENSITIVE 5-like protein 8 [Cardamine amara subsp. amara]|uniref:ABSCISIC ACID-INSENSITIVE 5-like protein 8 n=1 Tax=Cardamine amara subsp. amara TaxID=228776 RepID=A0ABD0ZVV0_CARAN
MDSNWNLTTLGNGLPDTSLSRQDSIYSWTIDQFQNSLGKDCGSMNMNELVNNISSAQEIQGVVSEGLKKQGSITLPRLLSQKNC